MSYASNDFDRATIAAYVDDELDLVTAKRIEKAMLDDRGLASLVAQERALRAKLAGHYAPVLDEALPDRLTALLSGNVDDSLNERRTVKTARWFQPAVMQWGAMAASLIVGLMIGGAALNRDTGYVRGDGGQLLASGALANALQTQLASAQGAKAEIRIGTSFAAKDGGYCRTFASTALDGIACNEGNNWKLRQTLSGKGSSEYRQASAGALAEAAAAMMAGDPLDEAGEKAAAAKGWK